MRWYKNIINGKKDSTTTKNKDMKKSMEKCTLLIWIEIKNTDLQ